MCVEHKINLTNSSEPTFSTTGYGANWKKATERFAKHGSSKCHTEASFKFATMSRGLNVSAMISSQKDDDRKNATDCLKIIFTSVLYIAKQGLGFRRSIEENGNFLQLVSLRSQDFVPLKAWLCKYRSYTSPQIQNEILEMLSREVLQSILTSVGKSNIFSILADESTDISSKQQLSFCIRYISDEFEAVEDFIGLYQLDSCSAEDIVKVLNDIVIRCDISWDNCRGLAFDGAATMSGIKSGVAARIQQDYPKALLAYCHMHCLNLCVKDTLSDDVPLMRDFFSNTLELTTFIRKSPKRMTQLRILNSNDAEAELKCETIRPLCPTRMTVKYKALIAIDSEVTSLQQLLEDIKNDRKCKHEVQSKAAGLLRWLESFEFCFAQTIALELFGLTDELSMQLQNPQMSAAEGLEEVLALKQLLLTKRRENHFEMLWEDVETRRKRFSATEPKLPRMRRAPRRVDEGGDAAQYQSTKEYFRVQYFMVLDKVITSISERFETDAWKTMNSMERLLVHSCRGDTVNDEDLNIVLQQSACELNHDLVGQLEQLRNIPMPDHERMRIKCFAHVRSLLKKERAVLRLLPQVVNLTQLVCVLPCSTATPERSFSQLRRIKSYLRSSMNQERLNHAMVAVIHGEHLDNIDLMKLITEFILRNEERRATFKLPK